jgi:hypothetical protein
MKILMTCVMIISGRLPLSWPYLSRVESQGSKLAPNKSDEAAITDLAIFFFLAVDC